MPSLSPNNDNIITLLQQPKQRQQQQQQTQCYSFLGLSPKSYAEFLARERSRLTDVSTNDDDLRHEEKSENDSDDGHEHDDDDVDDDSLEGLYETDDDTEEGDDVVIFHFETKHTPTVKKKKCKIPFWYESEDSYHLRQIVEAYKCELNFEEDNNINLHPPRALRDRRRLPTFIGRISRTPVQDKDNCFNDFTTLDEIQYYRRDIRPCGSTTTNIKSFFVLTSWDDDGMPDNFVVLNCPRKVNEWSTRKTVNGCKTSYIYCLPVWQSKTEFVYSVEREKHEVGYANQPFNYTQFLPKEVINPEDCELPGEPLDAPHTTTTTSTMATGQVLFLPFVEEN